MYLTILISIVLGLASILCVRHVRTFSRASLFLDTSSYSFCLLLLRLAVVIIVPCAVYETH